MKTTKKNIVNFVKQTDGEQNFVVLAFDKKTGKRELGYGGSDILNAFCVMSLKLRQGFDVILTDKTGWRYMWDREVTHADAHIGTRVTYSEMLPYAISFRDIDWGKTESDAVNCYKQI